MAQSVRRNNLIFTFAKETRRVQPTAVEIHDWLDEVIGINSDLAHTTQLDADSYCVYVKFFDSITVDRILGKIGNSVEFIHRDGSKSNVSVRRADVYYRTVRVFNVPIEVDNSKIRDALSKYGVVKDIVNERWGKQYKIQCFSGTRAVDMELKSSIPSYINVDGHKAHVIYNGQTPTCHVCNESGHLRQDCPRRVFVLKNNLTQRRKLTLNEILGSENAANQVESLTDTASSPTIPLDKNAFPPLVPKTNSDSSLRGNEGQPKKRPLALTEDHSDDETSSNLHAPRKQKPCDEGSVVQSEQMQVDMGSSPDASQTLHDLNVAAPQCEKFEMTEEVPSLENIGFANKVPQGEQIEEVVVTLQTENTPSQQTLSPCQQEEVLSQQAAAEVGTQAEGIRHMQNESQQQAVCSKQTLPADKQETLFSQQAVDTLPLGGKPKQITPADQQEPVLRTQHSVSADADAATQSPDKSTAVKEVKEVKRTKIKPKPNVNAPRSQAVSKSENTNKKSKNIRYDIIREGTDDESSLMVDPPLRQSPKKDHNV